MAKTYLDQIVDYPAKVIQKIAEDDTCVSFIVNKSVDAVTYDDKDAVLEQNIFDYQYVDDTTDEASAFIWVEMDVASVDNQQIKNNRIYIIVACHKSYMKLDPTTFRGTKGNRRDNIVRYIDKLLNNQIIAGIGKLKLQSVKPFTAANGFTSRIITYSIPDFNIVTTLE